MPGFVGVLDKSVKRLLELVPFADIAPGDIFVTNDPYYGGVTHLNDVVLAMPVFAGGALILAGELALRWSAATMWIHSISAPRASARAQKERLKRRKGETS